MLNDWLKGRWWHILGNYFSIKILPILNLESGLVYGILFTLNVNIAKKQKQKQKTC